MPESSRFLRLAGLAFALLALLEFGWLHLLRPLDEQLSDAFVRHHAQALTPDPDIVVIDIDDPSIARMQDVAGSWPWPRSVHGELVRGLLRQRPKAIVFDLQFTEPDQYRPDSDRLFNQALDAARTAGIPVYFPMVRREAELDAVGAPVAEAAPLLGLIAGPGADPAARIALVPPLALDRAHWRTGLINFLADEDGVGRRYFLYPAAAGWLLPSLPARVASDLGYPVPRQADMILSWRGTEAAFAHLSYFDLYQDFNRERPLRPADELKDRIVLIGTAATGLHDLRVTPIASAYPGVDILATALDNLKNQRPMRAAPPWAPAALTLALLLLLALLFERGAQALGIGAVLLLASLLALGAGYTAVTRLYLLPVLAALLLAWAYYFTGALHLYLGERQSRQHALRMFSRFVNPHVVRQVMARGGLPAGGESRQITVLFSDIRGFTSLSERRPPQEIVALLNRYFALQAEIIFRHGGTLDKFIGDCIMAFWGAPLDDPQHAERAVAAALEMAAALREFKRSLGPLEQDFDVGIGLHSGPAVVGLLGPQQKLEYTAIGDTVNLASRIEGMTKGVARILVSEQTRQLCGDAFDFAPMGAFTAKGREQEVRLFSPTKKGTQ